MFQICSIFHPKFDEKVPDLFPTQKMFQICSLYPPRFEKNVQDLFRPKIPPKTGARFVPFHPRDLKKSEQIWIHIFLELESFCLLLGRKL